MRDCLIEDRQPVTDRPLGSARDQRQCLGLSRYQFGLGNHREMRRQPVDRNPPQIKTLAP